MNAEEIWAAAAAKTMSPNEAVAALEKLGFHPADASDQIFITLGGDDVVLNGDNEGE